MRIEFKHLVWVLFSVAVLSGCVYVPMGEEVDVNFFGSIGVSDSTFVMDGYIATGGGVPDREYYENVLVQLYSENGELQCGAELGDLRADSGSLNVSVSTSIRPHYVVITSEDFWAEQVQVDYFTFDGESYERNQADGLDDYPIEVAAAEGSTC